MTISCAVRAMSPCSLAAPRAVPRYVPVAPCGASVCPVCFHEPASDFSFSKCAESSAAGRLGDDEAKEGWLEIGRPPPELKVDLPPLRLEEPRPGKLVLFPSYVFHGTRPFGAGERLTVAFDVIARC